MPTIAAQSVQSVAAVAAGLRLEATGVPQCPVRFVALDEAAGGEDIAAAAAAVRSSLGVSVGIATRPPDPSLRPLVEALTTTMVGAPVTDRMLVAVPDLDAAVAALAAAIGRSPQAAVTLARVLSQTAQLDVRDGLAAEAAAYSMLLAGGEFGRWLARRGPARPGAARGEPVRVGRDGDRLRVLLSRPERRNAMDARLRDDLVEALTVAVADPAVRVELAGAGPDFCSGGDLDEFGTAADVVAAYLVRLERHPGWLLHQLRDRATVRVHGACIGAGIEVPAFAGQVVATSTAYFALPEVAMGLVPGAGGTVSIPRRIGRWRAAWLGLTGERLDAVTAREWRLVDEVVGQ